MKRVYITTALTCLAVLLVTTGCFKLMNLAGGMDHIKVGFIYDNDESTPYTYNFALAKDALEEKYGEKIEVMSHSNVLDSEIEEPLRELADAGCNIIFFNGYSDLVPQLAPEYPNIQFCQTSYMDMYGQTVPDNYHTFKGEAYQARYVSGIAAGMKIKQLISEGIITEDQAKIGFVAAFQTSELTSGFTAFLLGARSVAPTTKLCVGYTGTWGSYAREKAVAEKLIDDGCVIITQHTDTIGPAIACEEASEAKKSVYFVGWCQSMSEVAPSTSIITARVCWEPYVLAATDAVMSEKSIESVVQARIHGTDASAGFQYGWVEMLDYNQQVMAPGTEQAMNNAIELFKRDSIDFVFRGNYTGVNADDPTDTIDLRDGYKENENTSYPLFNYILDDVVTVLE
ncbi:MAG: BMP family ABC transporter substrate-binding protein [Lachnospiraceae bacterium]|nr:BMP family ABC transporter substrate-binding protein [Lachnospiraceae bacterium]